MSLKLFLGRLLYSHILQGGAMKKHLRQKKVGQNNCFQMERMNKLKLIIRPYGYLNCVPF